MILLAALGLFILSPGRAFLLAINVVTFAVYGIDKWSAMKGRGRTPELTLHMLALLGGSPAAAGAQSLFRHKTKKRSFRRIFIAIISVQLVAIILWTF